MNDFGFGRSFIIRKASIGFVRMEVLRIKGALCKRVRSQETGILCTDACGSKEKDRAPQGHFRHRTLSTVFLSKLPPEKDYNNLLQSNTLSNPNETNFRQLQPTYFYFARNGIRQ